MYQQSNINNILQCLSIVSYANNVFIKPILKHHNFYDSAFKRKLRYTNPAKFMFLYKPSTYNITKQVYITSHIAVMIVHANMCKTSYIIFCYNESIIQSVGACSIAKSVTESIIFTCSMFNVNYVHMT